MPEGDYRSPFRALVGCTFLPVGAGGYINPVREHEQWELWEETEGSPFNPVHYGLPGSVAGPMRFYDDFTHVDPEAKPMIGSREHERPFPHVLVSTEYQPHQTPEQRDDQLAEAQQWTHHAFAPGWDAPEGWQREQRQQHPYEQGESCRNCLRPIPEQAPVVHLHKETSTPAGDTVYHAGPLCPGCAEAGPQHLRHVSASHMGEEAHGAAFVRRPMGRYAEPLAQPRSGGRITDRRQPTAPPADEGPFTGAGHQESHEPRPWTGHDIKESAGYCNPFAR